jgi:hypothetical protein
VDSDFERKTEISQQLAHQRDYWLKFEVQSTCSRSSQHTIFGIGFQDFNYIRNQIGQLLVEFDFFLVLFDAFTLATTFVCNTLYIRFHDSDIIAEQMNALSQFGNGHVTRLFVLDGLFLLLGLAAGTDSWSSTSSIAPNVVSFQIVSAHTAAANVNAM